MEFLLNLLCNGGDQIIDQSSDNEQDNDDVNAVFFKTKFHDEIEFLFSQEDQDVMEADLDLADKLQPIDQELNGDDLIFAQYSSQNPPTNNVRKSYNNILYASSVHDPVLHRPTTPGQLRQSIAAHTVDSLANSLAIGDVFHSQGNGFERTNGNNTIVAASTTSVSMKKPLSASTISSISNNNKMKISKTLSSVTRPKSATQQKQMTPVLAFDVNDELDRSIPTLSSQKVTPPMKFSLSEPPRSNSSASIRSSSSSTLELSNGNTTNPKAKKL